MPAKWDREFKWVSAILPLRTGFRWARNQPPQPWGPSFYTLVSSFLWILDKDSRAPCYTTYFLEALKEGFKKTQERVASLANLKELGAVVSQYHNKRCFSLQGKHKPEDGWGGMVIGPS